VIELARYALIIEQHYGRPMDIEWGKDGQDGQLYILQARPETVKSQAATRSSTATSSRGIAQVLAEGRAIGQKIGAGPGAPGAMPVSEMDRVQPGDVLVTDMTDPNWEPVMKRASAIVTNRGGRTCHAAIIARELGIPAVVGCGNATSTSATARGDGGVLEGDTGYIYDGLLEIEVARCGAANCHTLPVKIMMNVGNPNWPSISRRCQTAASVWRGSSSSSTTTSASTPRPSWTTRTSMPT
jgi:pyruvate,water dikinase